MTSKLGAKIDGSTTKKKIIECNFNMSFKQISCDRSLGSVDQQTIQSIARSILIQQFNNGSLLDVIGVSSYRDMFYVESDIGRESFSTGEIKLRKLIRFKLTDELLPNLYYGIDLPHLSIFSYVFNTKSYDLSLYDLESTKIGRSKGVLQFDIRKKIESTLNHSDFFIGLVVITKGENMGTKLDILNGSFMFTKFVDNDQKRGIGTSCIDTPQSKKTKSSDDQKMSVDVCLVSSAMPDVPDTSYKKEKTIEVKKVNSFEMYMRILSEKISLIKTFKDFNSFIKEDESGNILAKIIDRINTVNTNSMPKFEDGHPNKYC